MTLEAKRAIAAAIETLRPWESDSGLAHCVAISAVLAQLRAIGDDWEPISEKHRDDEPPTHAQPLPQPPAEKGA